MYVPLKILLPAWSQPTPQSVKYSNLPFHTMIVSCFGSPLKGKSKKTKKAPKKVKPTPAHMGKNEDVLDYIMYGTLRPLTPYRPWRTPGDIFSHSEWTSHQTTPETHQKTLDDTFEQTRENGARIAQLQDSIGDFRDAHSDHVKRTDECFAEVQQVYKHLAAEAKKRDDLERARYWKQRLEESYEAGRREGKDEASSLQTKSRQEDHASELRALREELEVVKQERSKRHHIESHRKADEEMVERVLRRCHQFRGEDRERLDRLQRSEEDRASRLADRLWQERYSHDRGSAFERERRPYVTPKTPSRRAPPPTHLNYTVPDDMLPWMEETVEEEFPVYHPMSRKERRRTIIPRRGPSIWDYR
ncbi:hypothetical protein BJ170DRAFT_15825 [Xylariales sp. AK1849]|nr:hypothetical protein BJ170DRAFT_15825 [Xylariales sp. AK1849]